MAKISFKRSSQSFAQLPQLKSPSQASSQIKEKKNFSMHLRSQSNGLCSQNKMNKSNQQSTLSLQGTLKAINSPQNSIKSQKALHNHLSKSERTIGINTNFGVQDFYKFQGQSQLNNKNINLNSANNLSKQRPNDSIILMNDRETCKNFNENGYLLNQGLNQDILQEYQFAHNYQQKNSELTTATNSPEFNKYFKNNSNKNVQKQFKINNRNVVKEQQQKNTQNKQPKVKGPKKQKLLSVVGHNYFQSGATNFNNNNNSNNNNNIFIKNSNKFSTIYTPHSSTQLTIRSSQNSKQQQQQQNLINHDHVFAERYMMKENRHDTILQQYGQNNQQQYQSLVENYQEQLQSYTQTKYEDQSTEAIEEFQFDEFFKCPQNNNTTDCQSQSIQDFYDPNVDIITEMIIEKFQNEQQYQKSLQTMKERCDQETSQVQEEFQNNEFIEVQPDNICNQKVDIEYQQQQELMYNNMLENSDSSSNSIQKYLKLQQQQQNAQMNSLVHVQ